ncbi:uncharacterized protein LOC119613076 [Lucilia sericata]|uniref:uncharacterized protein LOC119613076 n=1 Tax=Lucilia sericata TaxID=13632 RepID=UPI0018A83407|nr:uncharacterized protein LOC119613076 [Lucilia sericata]
MNSFVKILNLSLSMIILNGLLNVEAQSGTSVILGSKHYYIETTEQVGFYEAANNCAQLGMSLASLDANTDERKRVYSFLTINEILDSKYWLSGIKTGSTSYTWLGTGKPLKAAPTGTAGDCVATTATFENDGQDCTTSHYYICEKPIEPPCGKYGQCRYSFSSYNS